MKLQNKKILVISQVYPYPLHDGGRFDVYYRLKALFELDYNVTLVAFYNPALAEPELDPLLSFCSKTIPIPYLRRQWSKILHWKPYSIASRENTKLIMEAIESIQGDVFQAVMAESHHVLTVARQFQEGLDIPRLYLRSHNNEARFMLSLAQTSPKFSVRQFFFFAEACKYACYLPILMRSMQSKDRIFHISHDECEKGKRGYPHINQSFLPAAIDSTQMTPNRESLKKNVLFAGALFSPNNLQGLQWYLNKIHPHLVKEMPDYQLLIAGNTKGADPKAIDRLVGGLLAIKFYDTPPDMSPVYEEAQVFINPMQYGAGVKLKTVDALLKGLPVVTTTIGNEGTGFQNEQDLLIADDPNQFRKAVLQLLNNAPRRQAMVERAQLFLKDHYDQKKALGSLL